MPALCVARRRMLAMVAAGLLWVPALAAGDAGGELRLRWEAVGANPQGPIAKANALVPDITPVQPSSALAEAELRASWRALSANLLLWSEHPEGGTTESGARFNELYASGDFGAWQASAGRKIVGWDVGYGFRPNDFVQQERRLTLLTLTQQGRPLLQVEHFDAETATSLVWVNPQHTRDSDDEQRFADEAALALRWYKRAGATDGYLFGRIGQHTGASLGAALAWVASDSLELHASARVLQRHDGWQLDSGAGNAPVVSNPWQVATLGRTSQLLLGASWTGALQQSVIVEWWRDGTALPDADWDAWGLRNAALAELGAQPGLPAAAQRAIAGNLAWQATPFNVSNLRRDNLFLRLAWQPEHWLLSLDALVEPADRGRMLTAGLQWQGDRLRLNAAGRVFGGPADSLFAQIPRRRSATLAAAWAF